MNAVAQFDTVWTGGTLRPEGIALDALFDVVMRECVTVLHGVFPAEQLSGLRDSVHQWGATTEVKPPQTFLDENYHTVESGISPRQKTAHNFHAYNFNRIGALDDKDMAKRLTAVFDPLREFQNALTRNQGTYAKNAEGRKLHPQVIHYPSGGGMFGRHTHPLEPQRIGLILGLSQRGRDFTTGATHFLAGERDIGTGDIHDIGDLILFRFDIPHWISAIDENELLDYRSPNGRWTAVLPYY